VGERGADATIRNSTFADTVDSAAILQPVVRLAGLLATNPSRLHVESSLFANNAGPALEDQGPPGTGVLTTAYNLFDTLPAALPPGTVCAGSTAGGANLCGIAAPGLDPLGSNGGPTQTMALQPAGPAVDAGSNPGSLTSDQRGAGFLRTGGAAADIGAFEVQTGTCALNVVQFSAATYSVGEGTPTATITVTRTGDCPGSVEYQTADGSADEPTDYGAASGTFLLPAGGPSSLTFAVSVVDDANVEGTESLQLLLHSPDPNTSLGPGASAALEILDNDGACTPSTVSFASPTFSVGEGDGTATITVQRTGTCLVTVDYATANGSATAPADYAATSGSLVFPENGASSLTLAVPIVDDSLVEGDETLALTLTIAAGPAPPSATLVIVDDDLTSATEIPALGEWGLVLLVLGLGAAGMRRSS
jgi:hypothetical protein